MCCFNKANLSAILLVHKHIINKDCTVKNNDKILPRSKSILTTLTAPLLYL